MTKWILTCSVIFLIIRDSLQFPEDITKCKYDDSKCLIDSMNYVFKNKFEGIPEMGLSRLDPLKLDKMVISQGGDGPISLRLEYYNFTVSGLKNAEVYKATGFKKGPGTNKIEIRMKAPEIRTVGPYKGKGKIMFLPVQGNGEANITMINFDLTLKLLAEKVERDGKIYMNIIKNKFDFDISGYYSHYSNLFNGDKVLGDNMNNFFNSNWRDIMVELKPSMSAAFGNIYTALINKVFASIPYEELFLD